MKVLTISSKGQIAIPKEIRDFLNIKEGDRLVYKIDRGRIVLEPVVSVPRSQSYFLTPEVQEKIKNADENFKAGNFKTYKVDKFIEELKE